MTDNELIELKLEIPAGDSTEEELDSMARQLLSELKESDVESAELAKGDSAPAGTKSIDPVTAGAIAVAVLPSMLTKIIETLQAWLLRDSKRTIKFKGKVAGQMIEFEGAAEDLEKLLRSLRAKKPKK